MLPVEILPVQETIVLRARGSELLILPHHVKKLKGLPKPVDFSQYFRAEALVNRPARKLFEAWLRKDQSLWPRLYQTVHNEIEFSAEPETEAGGPSTHQGHAPAAAEPVTTSKAEVQAEPAPQPKKAPKAKAVKDSGESATLPKGTAKKALKNADMIDGEEPKKKEKAVKKSAPKEDSAPKKKAAATTKSKASAEDKSKSKKG